MKRLPGDWTLWAAVIGLFALLLGAWAVLFTLARRNPVQTVPLEHRQVESAAKP